MTSTVQACVCGFMAVRVQLELALTSHQTCALLRHSHREVSPHLLRATPPLSRNSLPKWIIHRPQRYSRLQTVFFLCVSNFPGCFFSNPQENSSFLVGYEKTHRENRTHREIHIFLSVEEKLMGKLMYTQGKELPGLTV